MWQLVSRIKPAHESERAWAELHFRVRNATERAEFTEPHRVELDSFPTLLFYVKSLNPAPGQLSFDSGDGVYQ